MSNLLVIVRRIDAIVVRQAKDLGVHILIEALRAALLEIGASAAANQQRVARKDAALLVDHVAHAAVGVPRCGQRIYRVASELDAIALLDVAIRLGAARRCDHRLAARQLPQPAAARYVVRVHVRVN